MLSRIPEASGRVRRLRTRTGCLTCRDRKKKCDERWPICTACDRNLLTCCWRHERSSPDSKKGQYRSTSTPQQAFKNETSGLSNKRGNLVVVESMTNSTVAWPKLLPLTLDTAQTPGLRTAADRNLFAYWIDKVLPVMARPYVHTDYERFSHQLTIALHQPILMDVLLASAATHLSAGNSDKQFQALKYYSSAVYKLRQKIAGSEIDGTEDWLAFVAMALCLFERWNTSRQPRAGLHLLGAFQIFRLRLSRPKAIGTDTDLKFDRCLAETIVYHLSILPLFEGAHLTGSLEIWEELTNALTMKAVPNLPQWANSPLLGGRPSLFLLIGEITGLRLRGATREHTLSLTRRLFDEDYLIRSRALMAWNQDARSACYRELRLFSTAAKILLYKSTNPDCAATDPSIQDLVCEGMEQLTCWASANRFDQYFCWPLLIIGCAVTQYVHMGIIREKLSEMWCCSHCGDIWRVGTVLERAWNGQRGVSTVGSLDDAESEKDALYGFDILLSKGGLFNLVFD